MTRNLKAEFSRNNADAPGEQKAPFGGWVEGVKEKLGGPAVMHPVQSRAPPYRMLRFPDVIAATGLSRTTIWRRVKAGTFPAPLSLGENSCGWPENFIQEWVGSRSVVHYAPKAATANMASVTKRSAN